MEDKEYLSSIIKELSKPLDYKWKLQSYNKAKTNALCVAYIDSRAVIQRLNEVCVYGWHREHFALGDDKYCRLGVVMPSGAINWRTDVGESDNATEKSKTASSDSFKRSAINFGLGLFLYDLKIQTLPVKQDGNFYNIVDDQGNKVWDLTQYINDKLKSPNQQPKQPTKPATLSIQGTPPKQIIQPSQKFNKPVGESALQKAFKPFNYLTQVLPLLKELRETNEDWKDVGLCADIVTFEKGVPKELQTAIYNKLKTK